MDVADIPSRRPVDFSDFSLKKPSLEGHYLKDLSASEGDGRIILSILVGSMVFTVLLVLTLSEPLHVVRANASFVSFAACMCGLVGWTWSRAINKFANKNMWFYRAPINSHAGTVSMAVFTMRPRKTFITFVLHNDIKAIFGKSAICFLNGFVGAAVDSPSVVMLAAPSSLRCRIGTVVNKARLHFLSPNSGKSSSMAAYRQGGI